MNLSRGGGGGGVYAAADTRAADPTDVSSAPLPFSYPLTAIRERRSNSSLLDVINTAAARRAILINHAAEHALLKTSA